MSERASTGTLKEEEGRGDCKLNYLVWATGMLRNSPVPAKSTQMWTNYHHSPTLEPTSIASGHTAAGGQKQRGGEGPEGRIWGEKEYGPVDDADAEKEAGGAERGDTARGHARRWRSLVRPERRRSHHRGWRLAAGHLGCLCLLVRKGGEGKRRLRPSPQVDRSD